MPSAPQGRGHRRRDIVYIEIFRGMPALLTIFGMAYIVPIAFGWRFPGGPSGSGKSTLLRSVNRLEEPTAGRILIEGVDITNDEADLDMVRTRIGMVSQQFNLFPHLSVLRNLTLPQQRVLRRKPAEARKTARAMLERGGHARVPLQVL